RPCGAPSLPYTTLFRSSTPRVLMREDADLGVGEFGIATQYQEPERGSRRTREVAQHVEDDAPRHEPAPSPPADEEEGMTRVYRPDRKRTRLNSSHVKIS